MPEPRAARVGTASLPDLPGYELGHIVGRGTGGIVVTARQVSLDRLCAVKILTAREAVAEADRERFRDEARLLAALEHPGIVRIHDFVDTGDVLAIVMELVPGGSLRNVLDRHRLSAAQFVGATVSIAEALDAAHRGGIVHRDLKPANVLVTARGECRVADFGVARLLHAGTAQGDIVGTPAYMAPEQARGLPGVDGRADVWALGVIAYELVVGRPPYRGAPADILAALRAGIPPPPLSHMEESVPRRVEAVLMEALALAPTDRPALALPWAHRLAASCRRAWPAATRGPVPLMPQPMFDMDDHAVGAPTMGLDEVPTLVIDHTAQSRADAGGSAARPVLATSCPSAVRRWHGPRSQKALRWRVLLVIDILVLVIAVIVLIIGRHR